ncbi:hypothetical protein AK973_4676 [Pseudomonas brassicacearum]|nr:hypothetical protein AK973_4676 [Pseudomonas brassicacearum]
MGGVTPWDVEVTGFDTERNFIKHCGLDRKARHSTPFFVRVKPKKTSTPVLEQALGTIHRSCG